MSSARPSGYGGPKAAGAGSPAVTLNNRVTVEEGGITDISRKVAFLIKYADKVEWLSSPEQNPDTI